MNAKAHLPGFTLVELTVGIAIAGFIAAAAVAASASITAQLHRNEQIALSYDQAKTLMDYLVTDAQAAGGGALRPWTSVQVVDDAAASGLAGLPADLQAGTDLLLFIEPDDTIPECGFGSRSGANLNAIQTDPCCLGSVHEGRPLTIVNGDGTLWGTSTSNSVHGGPSGCAKINFPPGQNESFGPGADKVPGSDIDAGTLIAATFRRLYVNDAHELILQEDADGDGGLEDFLIAERVYDLQIALGYDSDGDGFIAEDGTSDDEWLHNAAGDALGAGGLATAQDRDLRMALIGITVGTPLAGSSSTRALLNGPAVTETDVLLRSTTGRAYLRNLNIFF